MLDAVDVVVVGHTCLDMIPTLIEGRTQLREVLRPGEMVGVGPLALSTGGAVPNTGLALHRLGVPVRLVGKVGDDVVGRVTLEVLRSHGPHLADDMAPAEGARSSYTVILSAPDVDRTFLHYPGPNATFRAADVPDAALRGARLLHLGYPPLLPRMYRDDGAELVSLFRRAKAHGLATSLDMTLPDPDSEAARVDWPALLARVLPHVDGFLPNVEEALFALDPARYARLAEAHGPQGVLLQVDGDLLSELATRLLDRGVALVMLKLGEHGIYARTTGDPRRLRELGDRLALPQESWLDRELLVPAFDTLPVGTTGAGDAAVAGFLRGALEALPLEATLVAAAAVGACNVEAADAVSGIPAWDDVRRRIKAGWAQQPTSLQLKGWGLDVTRRMWVGPRDRGGQIALG
jgi:sugar/nucleoside kinase (ribokinase family)